MPRVEIPDDAKADRKRRIGLTIAIIATQPVVVSSLGNDEDDEKIVAEVTASNGFTRHQSKRIRQGMDEQIQKQAKAHQEGAERAAGTGDRHNKAKIFLQIGVSAFLT